MTLQGVMTLRLGKAGSTEFFDPGSSSSGGSGPAAGTLWRVLHGSAKLMRPGETEAGSAGRNRAEG
ncbi:MAG: hypothetical protein DMG24_22505 [Acidobacteria bacterium]|nr:MAG: hypothetical protein DMG24_22505 [Acidobacteriota bacterium]